MTTVRFRHRSLEVTCALEQAAAADRLAAWRALLDGGERQGIAGGVRLWLRPALHDAVVELAVRESRCCPFLDFELVTEGDCLRLDVTSLVPEADPVFAAITGAVPTTRGGSGSGLAASARHT